MKFMFPGQNGQEVIMKQEPVQAGKIHYLSPGDWQASMFAFGECLPDYKNHVYLDETQKR